MWDPYVLFPALFPPGSIQCPLCGTSTKFSYWNGLTMSLINLCTSLTVQGKNFYNMETLIVEKRWEAWSKQTDILVCHKKILGENIPRTDFWSSPFAVSPSNDVLPKCFLARFLQNEQTYLRKIACVPTGTAISFKVAANIGHLRVDGRWVHQYDSLFLVMNREGKVVSWQLTKGTSFSDRVC